LGAALTVGELRKIAFEFLGEEGMYMGSLFAVAFPRHPEYNDQLHMIRDRLRYGRATWYAYGETIPLVIFLYLNGAVNADMMNGFIEYPGSGQNRRRRDADITRIRNGVNDLLEELGRHDLVNELELLRIQQGAGQQHAIPQAHVVVAPQLITPTEDETVMFGHTGGMHFIPPNLHGQYTDNDPRLMEWLQEL
jgi:hypothetical protein